MTQFKQKMLTVILVMLMTNTLFAQQIDHKKMEKDIEIAENILYSLMKNNDELMFHASTPNGTYVPEYGVILRISGSRDYYNFNFDNEFSFSFDVGELARNAAELARESEELEEQIGNVVIVAPDGDAVFSDDYDEDDDRDDDIVYFPSGTNKTNIKLEQKSKEEIEEFRNRKNEILKDFMKEFLVDYSDLISQIKPDQKIMVVSGSNHSRLPYLSLGSTSRNKIAAEVIKSDLTDYKSGKLTREKLMEKIRITESKASDKKETDLELLSTIFRRLYKPDLSDTYYMSGGLRYERLEGFGVIYNMKVYSSTSDRGRHKIITQGLSGLTQEERDKKVEELYPQFEKELKENILNYGKTLRSLKHNENLMFKVRLTECKGCSIPRSIDVTVSQSVLSDFNSGKLSQSTALNKVTVKKYNQ